MWFLQSCAFFRPVVFVLRFKMYVTQFVHYVFVLVVHTPEVVLRLRVGDLHLPGHVVRHAARALRLRVGDLHLPGVRYVSALVIYICQSPCLRRADP